MSPAAMPGLPPAGGPVRAPFRPGSTLLLPIYKEAQSGLSGSSQVLRQPVRTRAAA